MFITQSSGEVAGMSFIRRRASNILSSGILLDVMAFSYNKKDIFTPFLVMGLRYLFVPIRMDELICVVSPMDANAAVPVMYLLFSSVKLTMVTRSKLDFD